MVYDWETVPAMEKSPPLPCMHAYVLHQRLHMMHACIYISIYTTHQRLHMPCLVTSFEVSSLPDLSKSKS